MSAVAAGIGVGAAAGLGSAYLSSQASKSAAQMQYQAAEDAIGLQREEFNTQQANEAPWLAAGRGALSQMQDPYFQQNFSAADMQMDPGYQFRMDQGQKALEASAAARGGLMGGNFAQALTQYGQNYASNEYQNAYNRFTNNQTQRYNRLASLAGLGQQANAQIGQAGETMANQAGNYMTGAANAMGAAGIASANAWGGAMNNIGNLGMQYGMLSKYGNPTPTNPGPGYGGYGGDIPSADAFSYSGSLGSLGGP